MPLLLLLLTASIPSFGGEWTLRLEPTMMDAIGHDQHVLLECDDRTPEHTPTRQVL